MATTRYPKKSPCPCGSGKKYRQCCANKSFKFVYKDGRLHKVTPIGRDVMEALEHQRRTFRTKFGRDPRAGEPLFFDPDAKAPQFMDLEKFRRALVAGMRVAGVDPAHIYAFEQSGYFVTEQNRALVPDVGLQAWDDAVSRYQARHTLV